MVDRLLSLICSLSRNLLCTLLKWIRGGMTAWIDGFRWLLLGTEEGSVTFGGCCWELKRDRWLLVTVVGSVAFGGCLDWWLLLGTFGGFCFSV